MLFYNGILIMNVVHQKYECWTCYNSDECEAGSIGLQIFLMLSCISSMFMGFSFSLHMVTEKNGRNTAKVTRKNCEAGKKNCSDSVVKLS